MKTQCLNGLASNSTCSMVPKKFPGATPLRNNVRSGLKKEQIHPAPWDGGI